MTEKTFDILEKQNKIVFMVEEKAGKRAIKDAVETLYKVKVRKINTTRVFKGKKAYVTLSSETPASELATKLGLV